VNVQTLHERDTIKRIKSERDTTVKKIRSTTQCVKKMERINARVS